LAIFPSRNQLDSQALDDGIIQSFPLRGSAHGGYVVGKLLGQEVQSGNDFVGGEVPF
jgi:hypothetical protein